MGILFLTIVIMVRIQTPFTIFFYLIKVNVGSLLMSVIKYKNNMKYFLLTNLFSSCQTEITITLS